MSKSKQIVKLRKIPVRLSILVPGGLRVSNRLISFCNNEVTEIPERECTICLTFSGRVWPFKQQLPSWRPGTTEDVLEVVLVPENPANATDILWDMRNDKNSEWSEG